MITNDFGVEYGHASGSVVNYVTKSGTNAFHGSGFDYFTGSHFDSHDNLELGTDTIPRYVENRFGGTIGGPIKHDKAWFFFSPYFDRQRSAGSPSTSGKNLTPTPAGLQQLAAAFPNNRAVAALTAIGPYAVAAGSPQPLATQTITVSNGTTNAPIEFAPVQRNVPALFNDRELRATFSSRASKPELPADLLQAPGLISRRGISKLRWTGRGRSTMPW